MSFASNARAEMARELCKDQCCARAELAAALLASGGISYRFGSGHGYALSITTAEAAVVRHYFQLLKRHFNITAQIRTLYTESLSGQKRYQLMIPEEESLKLLEETMLLDDEALFGVNDRQSEETVLCNHTGNVFLVGVRIGVDNVLFHNIAYHGVGGGKH